MKNRIIEICELGQPQSIIHRENQPITELIKTADLIEELNKQLDIQRVSQQRELFDAILDFTEGLPMCTEDYHRSELWEKYKALNCG